MPQNLWNDAAASGKAGLDLLAYRSSLLAQDRAVVNVFGGNTSSKVDELDHLGRTVRVLWVKGSGSDMAGCTPESFAGLRLDDLKPLLERKSMSDEEMVGYLAHCVLEPGRPRQSIETLLHAFLPFSEVDHTHPDAIIALACTKRGRDAAASVFGDRMVWVDYIRPGFELSLRIHQAVSECPDAECVIMGKHGLVTWGSTAKESYSKAIAIIDEAEAAIRLAGQRVWTGADLESNNDAYHILPVLRGAISSERKQILTWDTSKRVMQMINTPAAGDLSQVGAACPDHLVHVKQKPLFIDISSESVEQALRAAVEDYRKNYSAYFSDHATPDDVMSDSSPRVVLVPGFGMVCSGRDARQAQVSADLYHRAIEVIEGAEAMGGFESLTPAETFGIEYWPLELYKLKQRRPDRELSGHIAIVTGGGSGIGRATALRLAEEGAHVAILDKNMRGAEETAVQIGGGVALPMECDVTDEVAVEGAFRKTVSRWGGVDIVVCSAGVASSDPIVSTTIEEWNRNIAVLATGYFLPAREAFRVWDRQQIGGSLVFVTSKNAVVAGKNASAYSAAKAAEQHLARCLAEEGGAIGVRVNCVMPDAVLRGSSIWDGNWRTERAAAYGIHPDGLEDFYKSRTTLKVNVLPEDVAEAILFLAGPRSLKTTGASITVDGGVAAAYVR